jgi:hypothetical protein
MRYIRHYQPNTQNPEVEIFRSYPTNHVQISRYGLLAAWSHRNRSLRARFSDRGQHIVGTEHFQQAQDLDELALARLAHACLEQTAQGRELFGQFPAGQATTGQRADFLFQKRQVVQRLKMKSSRW